MKSKINLYKKINQLFVFLFFLLTSLPTFAQDGFDEFGEDVPVDGGLVLLIVAGIGYGVKKLKGNISFSSNTKQVY